MDVEKFEKLAGKRGRPFKVLIVDDEPHVREVFKEFCELTNSIEIDLAENGNVAVEKVKSSEYDLITMDLIMPEMAGVEAVGKIKEVRPHLPVIIITGNATDRLVHQAGIKGASAILYKPVMLEDFIDELMLALDRKSYV